MNALNVNGSESTSANVIMDSKPLTAEKAATSQPQVPHVRRRPTSRFPQCKYCDGIFLSPILLASHVKNHEERACSISSPESLNRCTICGLRFLRFETLGLHMASRHPGCTPTLVIVKQESSVEPVKKPEEKDNCGEKQPDPPQSSGGRSRSPLPKKRLRNPEIRIDFVRSTSMQAATSSKKLPPLACSYCGTECDILPDMEQHVLSKHEDKLCLRS